MNCKFTPTPKFYDCSSNGPKRASISASVGATSVFDLRARLLAFRAVAPDGVLFNGGLACRHAMLFEIREYPSAFISKGQQLRPATRSNLLSVYRWREPGPQGKSIRRSLVLGTNEKIKTKAQALKAAEGHRLKLNDENATAREVTFGALIERFIIEERLRESKDRNRAVGLVEEDEAFDYELLEPSTASSYLSMIKVHIRPRWEIVPLFEVKPAKVEAWLKSIDREPKTKGHLKELLHRLFEKAMLWELLPFDRNPMDLVTIKGISKRSKQPIVLTVEQCLTLISLLPEPYCAMRTARLFAWHVRSCNKRMRS